MTGQGGPPVSRRLAAVALAVPPPRPLCLAQQRKEKRRRSSGKQCENEGVFDLLGRDTHMPEKGEGGAGGVAGDARPAIPHPGRDPNPSHRERERLSERGTEPNETGHGGATRGRRRRLGSSSTARRRRPFSRGRRVVLGKQLVN